MPAHTYNHLTLAFGLDDLKGTIWNDQLRAVAEVDVKYRDLPGWDQSLAEKDSVVLWLGGIGVLHLFQ